MKRLLWIISFFICLLSSNHLFAQNEGGDKQEDGKKKPKVKILKMESKKSKRDFRSDEHSSRPKSTERKDARKRKKELKAQRKKYEDLRVDQQHASTTRRMKRNERQAYHFNSMAKKSLWQRISDIQLPHFTFNKTFKKKTKRSGCQST